jgi:hypothetical protein
MKKVLAVTALIVFAGLIVVQPVLAGRGAGRHFKQEKRICQGIESGELTRGETRQLSKQQRRIRKSQRIAWADGTLTGKERVGLERQQNKASKNIYRMKHNNRQQTDL